MLENILQSDTLALHNPLPPVARKMLKPFAAPLLHVSKVNTLFSLYDGMARGLSPQAFSSAALDLLGVDVSVRGEGLANMPKEGPLVVVSNHPFGALEGLVLMATLIPHRPDMKFLANFMLSSIPEVRDIVINVNPFSTCNCRRENVKGLRQAVGHVKDGGCLAVFPAGEVSHLHPKQRGIMDPQWNRNVARIINKTDASVLPLFFHGRNSLMFNMMGLLHPLARTAMLPSELLKKRGKPVQLSVGNVITPAMLKNMRSEDDITTYLRARSYTLRPKKERRIFPVFGKTLQVMQPVAKPRPSGIIRLELENLHADQVLLREQGYVVYEARAFQILNTLHEIGRLREETFRQVDEGTGNSLDLDSYDYEYDHLILWHEKDQKIAGAYRVGQVDKLIETGGKKGLYCSSLFKFRTAFFTKFGNSLELGRALVQQEYQRDYAPLMLLWKGIGRFIAKRPSIRYLFGPCSMPLSFNDYTLHAAIKYLQEHHSNEEVSALVRGRKQPKFKVPKGIVDDLDMKAFNFNGLNCLIKGVEKGRSLPVLFKHYLKLGGTVSAFHVDNSFGSLDAFLMIDLKTAPEKMLQRYMGKENVAQFFRRHQAA